MTKKRERERRLTKERESINEREQENVRGEKQSDSVQSKYFHA